MVPNRKDTKAKKCTSGEDWPTVNESVQGSLQPPKEPRPKKGTPKEAKQQLDEEGNPIEGADDPLAGMGAPDEDEDEEEEAPNLESDDESDDEDEEPHEGGVDGDKWSVPIRDAECGDGPNKMKLHREGLCFAGQERAIQLCTDLAGTRASTAVLTLKPLFEHSQPAEWEHWKERKVGGKLKVVKDRRSGFLTRIGGAPVVYLGTAIEGEDHELTTTVRILNVHQAWVTGRVWEQWSDPRYLLTVTRRWL